MRQDGESVGMFRAGRSVLERGNKYTGCRPKLNRRILRAKGRISLGVGGSAPIGNTRRNTMERVPYELLGASTLVGRAICHRIRRVDLAERYGMTQEMLTFINVHCCCFRCGGPVNSLERHTACFLRSPTHARELSDYEVLVPEGLWGEFSAVKLRSSRLQQSHGRIQRIRTASGQPPTHEEMIALLERQERCCYYCFISLVGPSGRVNGPDEPVTCHADHFEALVHGGSREITNVVLACPYCNSLKRDMHGDDFVIEARERASKSSLVDLARIHQARAEFLRQFCDADAEDLVSR